jgi:C-terminal processing protease CtpA/Prc
MGAVSAARLASLSILLAVGALAAGGLAGCGASGPGSVGAVFGRDNETRALHVREVPEGTGAGKAGLAAGDEVVMIDGVYVRDLGAPEVRAKLRGELGTEVALTVVRGEHGAVVRHVKVVRAPLRAARAPAPREEKIAE